MALSLDTIRATADRVAATLGLEVVELDFQGGAKHRALRVFIEKDTAERARIAEAAAAGALELELSPEAILALASKDQLAGITHEDCHQFSVAFGDALDAEDLVPGTEYTLEVSSPGLDRKLLKPADYERFNGSLVQVQTIEPISGNRHWQGRLTAFTNSVAQLDLSAIRQKRPSRAKKATKSAAAKTVEIAFENIEKAQLIPEI